MKFYPRQRKGVINEIKHFAILLRKIEIPHKY